MKYLESPSASKEKRKNFEENKKQRDDTSERDYYASLMEIVRVKQI